MPPRYFRPDILVLEDRLALSTFTVINIADDGPGSLREAINSANAQAGYDVIQFAIGEPGTLQTIEFQRELPFLTDSVAIDGWSQGGPGYSGSPLIELHAATMMTSGSACFYVETNDCVIRGLVINGPCYLGIQIDGSGNRIQGNFFGVNASGTAATENLSDRSTIGITIEGGASNNLIGGDELGQGNLFGGLGMAIYITDPDTQDNVIQGNLIGTDITGTQAIPVPNGIEMQLLPKRTQIGGTTSGARNVIAGFRFSGIGGAYDSSVIQGNYIGVDATGTKAIQFENAIDYSAITINAGEGNLYQNNLIFAGYSSIFIQNSSHNIVSGNSIGADSSGISFSNRSQFGVRVSGDAHDNLIEGNLIANYDRSGVCIGETIADGSVRNQILRNTFLNGAGQPIDLGDDGFVSYFAVRFVHANNGQVPPVVSDVQTDANGTRATVTLDSPSQPNEKFHLELYTENQGTNRWTPIDFADLYSDASGHLEHIFTIPPQPEGILIHATATDDTSEFSPGVRVVLKDSSEVILPPQVIGFGNSQFVNAGKTGGDLQGAPYGGSFDPSRFDLGLAGGSGGFGEWGFYVTIINNEPQWGTAPEFAGQEIAIEAYRNGLWVVVDRTIVDDQGEFVLSQLHAGTYRIRLTRSLNRPALMDSEEMSELLRLWTETESGNEIVPALTHPNIWDESSATFLRFLDDLPNRGPAPTTAVASPDAFFAQEGADFVEGIPAFAQLADSA